MQDPSLRTYRIAFLGSNASGNLPMFTRVQATTGKRAIKAFIERCEPLCGVIHEISFIVRETPESVRQAERWQVPNKLTHRSHG